jgi:hypothetical protein
VKHIDGQNVRVENGDLVSAVKKLKQASGKEPQPSSDWTSLSHTS